MPSDERFSFRRPYQLREQAGFGRIGTDARAPGRAAVQGLGVEAIERALLYEVITGETNYSSLDQTDWTALDTDLLSWTLYTSGKRPVEFHMSAWLTSDPSDLMGVSLSWDGTEVSGCPYGIAGIYNQSNVTQVSGFCVLENPGPGRHTVQVVYKVSGGTTGFVQVDTLTSMVVMAKEI